MNLLAHLFLTRSAEPECMLGNFIADRVKGKAYLQHPPKVSQGIILHRKIDRFADDHPMMMKNKEVLHPYHGKWAGVVIDILNDHFLATEWELYSPDEDLKSFSERMHGILRSQTSLMEKKDRWILDRMIQDSWLEGYRYREGIHRAFVGLSKRTGEESFKDALRTLEEVEGELRPSFRSFFPELLAYIDRELPYETHEDRSPSDR